MKKELTMPDDFPAYVGKFIKMFVRFDSMLYGHLDSIKAVQHQVKLKKT